MTGSTCLRYADGGNVPQLLGFVNEAVKANETILLSRESIVDEFNMKYFVTPECAQNNTCPYGLMNYFQVFPAFMIYPKNAF